MKNNKHNFKKHTSFMIAIKIITCFLLCIAYCLFMNYLCYIFNDNYYYFRPIISRILSLFSCLSMFILCTIINLKRFKSILTNKKLSIVLCIFLVVVFTLPFLFIKTGTVADRESLKKIVFGNTVKEYRYEDIIQIDVSVKYGIQYEIEFKSNETVFLFGSEGFDNFHTDSKLVTFDKTISNECKKTVTQDPIWIEPWNTRRFFKTSEGFEYFDDFFSAYY